MAEAGDPQPERQGSPVTWVLVRARPPSLQQLGPLWTLDSLEVRRLGALKVF